MVEIPKTGGNPLRHLQQIVEIRPCPLFWEPYVPAWVWASAQVLEGAFMAPTKHGVLALCIGCWPGKARIFVRRIPVLFVHSLSALHLDIADPFLKCLFKRKIWGASYPFC